MILFVHVARRALLAFVGALGGIVGLFLVVDFAENASAFRGQGWFVAVVELYANRAAVAAYQTAPAAMLLAAGVTVSGLRRTSEYTAMRALGLGPGRVVVPVLTVAALVAVGLGWLEERVVVRAAARADEIMLESFHRGPARSVAERRRWFRGREGKRIYELGAGEGNRFERVTILDLREGFRLGRRIDARSMAPGETPGEWVLEGVTERNFGEDGRVEVETVPRRLYRFDEEREAFAVRPGRPAQLRRGELAEQVALRRRLGLPAQDFALHWHNKFAYPLAAIPGALMALGLALRRERRGYLTAALVEAIGVSLAFWGFQGLCWSMGISDRLLPVVAAWAPDALFLALGMVTVRRYA